MAAVAFGDASDQRFANHPEDIASVMDDQYRTNAVRSRLCDWIVVLSG